MGLTPYGSMNNSPMTFADPDGDLAFIAAVGIGAALGVIGNGVGNSMNNQPFFQGAGKAAAFGAIGGAVSFGIGSAATSLAGAGASNLGVAGFQAGAHALTGGALSAAQGGNFWHGAAAGAFSSAVGSGIGALGLGDGWQIFGGTLSGGFGSVVAGGNFVQGALQGAITSGLNHAAHNLFASDPPWDSNGDGRLSLSEANAWFRNGNGETITVPAGGVNLRFLRNADWEVGQSGYVQTLYRSSDGLIFGNIRVTYKGSGNFSLSPDVYDFDMHSWTSPRSIPRNIFTMIGSSVAGSGTPYRINFTGLNNPSYHARFRGF